MEVGEIKVGPVDFMVKITKGFESSRVKSSKPSCHFSRGPVAGSTERRSGLKPGCVEEKCAAMGSRHREFHITEKPD